MGGVHRRIEEDELHRHAHGGGVGFAIPASGGLHDDARPSRRPCSFQRRHRYFSLQCHRLQPSRNNPLSISLNTATLIFYYSVFAAHLHSTFVDHGLSCITPKSYCYHSELPNASNDHRIRLVVVV